MVKKEQITDRRNSFIDEFKKVDKTVIDVGSLKVYERKT